MITVLDKKSFTVGELQVLVTSQNDTSEEKPLQVSIQTEIDGITVAVTSSYSESCIGNRDGEYSHFDEEKAQKFVASHQRFLAQFEKDPSAQPDEVFEDMQEDEEDYEEDDEAGSICDVCGEEPHECTCTEDELDEGRAIW